MKSFTELVCCDECGEETEVSFVVTQGPFPEDDCAEPESDDGMTCEHCGGALAIGGGSDDDHATRRAESGYCQ